MPVMSMRHTTFPLSPPCAASASWSRGRGRRRMARDPPPRTRGNTDCFFCDPHCPPSDNYVALDAALRQLATFDWVVFTSVNGVIHVWERLAVLGLEVEAFASVRLAAIGPATTAALATRGLDGGARALCGGGPLEATTPCGPAFCCRRLI